MPSVLSFLGGARLARKLQEDVICSALRGGLVNSHDPGIGAEDLSGRPACSPRSRALLDTPHKPYEAALVVLGQLVGAVPSVGDGNNDSAPDAVWIFGRTIWAVWEAKSEAKQDGELGADDVRQAGRASALHRYPTGRGGSRRLPRAADDPQARIHPSGHAVAESHVYLLRPDHVVDVFVRAWRTARTRYFDYLTPTAPAAIFTAEGALPSQWLPRLRTVPLQQNDGFE
jgi:hypothetical protein